MSDKIIEMLECIDTALLRICTYQHKQTELLEQLVELNQKKRAPTQRSTFNPPTVDEVKEYVNKINGSIDPNGFIDYYQARGWKLNNGTPVKDWQACVRTWERNGFNKAPKTESNGAVI